MSTLIKKITVKHVCGEIAVNKIGEEKQLCIIMGYAKGSEIKNTAYGESIAFHGDFKAVNVETGEEFRSGTCYLPDVAGDLLKNALEASDGVVEFGFTIGVVGVKGRNDGETGKYEYRCKPLMKAVENDPMAQLEAKLKANVEQPKLKLAKGGK